MCQDYRTNAKPPAPAKATWRARCWPWLGLMLYWGPIVLAIGGSVYVVVRNNLRTERQVTCADEAFWLLKAEEVRCKPGQLLDIDYAKGWATCRCDAMAPLRDAWRKEAGDHMAEIDEKIVAHGHQFEVVAMQFESLLGRVAVQEAGLKSLEAKRGSK